MPEFEDITKSVVSGARDAAYVVVGLGVLGVQKAQVRRRELAEKLPVADLDEAVKGLRTEFVSRSKEVNELVESTIAKVEAAISPLESQLPTVARDFVTQAHDQARELRLTVLGILEGIAA